MRQFPQALVDFAQALQIEPGRADALYGLGIARPLNGDVTEGNASIAAGKAIEPGIADRLKRQNLLP